jgi:hypothetical protein
MTANEVRIVTIAGSSVEMGHAHGEQCRDQINELYEQRRSLILSQARHISADGLSRIAQGLWKAVQSASDPVALEVAATAEGANLLPEDLVIAGGYTDLLDVVGADPTPHASECTVSIDAERGVIAGTWDSHPSARNGLILLRRQPSTGPPTLALTTAGWPFQYGINGAGLGLAVTNLTPDKGSRKGLVYIAAVAMTTECKDVIRVEEVWRGIQFASGHAYLALDEQGIGSICESSARGLTIRRVVTSDVQANHYVDEGFESNYAYPYLQGSIDRMAEIGAARSEFAGPQEFSSWLAKSSCVNRRDTSTPATTCAVYYIIPAERTIWFKGGPADGEKLTMANLEI